MTNIRLFTFCLINILVFNSSLAQKAVTYKKVTYFTGITTIHDEISVNTKDMIVLTLNYTYHSRIDEEDIPYIYDTFGQAYNNQFCLPAIRTTIRETIGMYSLDEIFGSESESVQDLVLSKSREKLQEYNINLIDIFFVSIVLPPELERAIEETRIAQQQVLTEKYYVEIEKIKAEQSRIESEKIAVCNQILDSSLTEKVLQLKYIETLAELIQSQNVKIIVLGSDKLELPDILNESEEGSCEDHRVSN
jgi:regulator of protease activity HflC (stomatin/prohibitin superfamily)